ncbi:MAG: BTAD domain-containing putative transcriptional regulator [Ardenticatenia bacterium]|nr:BTAD domain-containing putative transcriptional regulator [Ardenticatenia bacterium]
MAVFEKSITRCLEALPTIPPPARLLELSEAVTLYRGDFLEDIYDDWALLERERLRELYLRALERLITLHKQQGNYEGALTYAQRLATADPLRETAHRELMRLYHLLGRDHAALEQYATLRQLLADELGLEPAAAATTALYHEIGAALKNADVPHLPTPSPSPPTLREIGHLPFVGRDAERAALLEAVEAAGRGHGGVVLIEGEAGVGKTRLVEEIVAGARWRGMLVAIGQALADGAASYHLLADALLPLLTPLRISQLAALVKPLWLSAVAPLLPPIAAHLPDLPALPDLEPRRERERLWEGLARCLDGLARATPLVLILEDLHWADEATLAALPHLASRLRESRFLMVLTCRSGEARERGITWQTLDALDRVQPLQRLCLSPLRRRGDRRPGGVGPLRHGGGSPLRPAAVVRDGRQRPLPGRDAQVAPRGRETRPRGRRLLALPHSGGPLASRGLPPDRRHRAPGPPDAAPTGRAGGGGGAGGGGRVPCPRPCCCGTGHFASGVGRADPPGLPDRD